MKSSRRQSSIARGISVFASPEEYDELIAEFIRDANPRDVVERKLVTDAGHLSWEIDQHRQMKAKTIAQASYDEISQIVWNSLMHAKIDEIEKHDDAVRGCTWLEENEPDTLKEIKQRAHDAAVRWSESDEGRSEVAKLLQELGADETEVELKVFQECRDELEHLEGSIAMWENRRMSTFRSFWEHRTFSAQKGRAASRVIEGGAPSPQRLTQQT
jgi:hypothetical protein